MELIPWHYSSVLESWDLIGQVPKRTQNNIVLLKELSSQMTPNMFLLNSHISVFLSHHQRNFSPQWLGTDPPLDNVQKVRDLGTLGSKWDALIKPLSSQFREICRSGGRKVERVGGRWKTPREQVLLHTIELMHIKLTETLATCKGPEQVWDRQGPWSERTNAHKSPFLTQKLPPTNNYSQKENLISWTVSHLLQKTHLSSGPILSKWNPIQNKLNGAFEGTMFLSHDTLSECFLFFVL